MLAGLAFCEMRSQYPQRVFQGFSEGLRGGHQQFATQTLRVHLLGLDVAQAENMQLLKPLFFCRNLGLGGLGFSGTLFGHLGVFFFFGGGGGGAGILSVVAVVFVDLLLLFLF